MNNTSIVLKSQYYTIPPGKTDPKNPSQRKFQKGSTNDRCGHYAMRLITPRKGDPDYPNEIRLQDRSLSKFSQLAKPSDLTDKNFEKVYLEFFKKQGITYESILKYLILKSIEASPALAFLKTIEDEDERCKKFLEIPACQLALERARKTSDYNCLYVHKLTKLYRDIFNLKVSNFEPLESGSEAENCDRLLTALKDGPMIVRGYFGQPFYRIHASFKNDSLLGKVLAWEQNHHEPIKEGEMCHVVAITGAAAFKQNNQTFYRVYFVDPNDASDPKVTRRVYAMSLKTFLKYLQPFERMDDPSKSKKPGFGIQREAIKQQTPAPLTNKKVEEIKQTSAPLTNKKELDIQKISLAIFSLMAALVYINLSNTNK